MTNQRHGKWVKKAPQIGDEIIVQRSVLGGLLTYTHHGVYFGDNEVYQFHGDLSHIANAQIDISTLEDFRTADGKYKNSEVQVYVPAANEIKLPINVIKERAQSRLGKKGYCDKKQHYRPFFNNCEHFATWCCYGSAQCYQYNFGKYFAAGGTILCGLLMFLLFYTYSLSIETNLLLTVLSSQVGFFSGIICSMQLLHNKLQIISILCSIILTVSIFLTNVISSFSKPINQLEKKPF